MRKYVSNKLTAFILTSDFNEKIKDFISSEFLLLRVVLNELQHIKKSFYLMSWSCLNSLESQFFL